MMDIGPEGLTFSFNAELWVYHSDKGGSWHFLTLPTDVAEDIRFYRPVRGGFGSVKVAVTLGNQHWKTSVFPSKEQGSFILPVKASVRTACQIGAGDSVAVTLQVAPENL